MIKNGELLFFRTPIKLSFFVWRIIFTNRSLKRMLLILFSCMSDNISRFI